MSVKLQSKLVGRSETDQSASFLIDENHRQEDTNVILCSSNLNLPTHSHKAAEYLGLRTGYSVYRQARPEVEKPVVSNLKRKYDCKIFESESPVEPFRSLPHPNDLFGKSRRKESKRRIQINPVHFHSMQLHKKQAKLNLTTNEQQAKSEQESLNQGHHILKAETHTMPELDSFSQHTSSTDFKIDSSKLFAHSFDNEFKLEKPIHCIKSPVHFPFSFKDSSKLFEE